MISIKPTEITYSDYVFLDEHRNEKLTDDEYKLLILDKFICPELQDELIQDGICPQCGDNLEKIQDGNEHYEYQGKQIEQPTYKKQCENCGFTYDGDD